MTQFSVRAFAAFFALAMLGPRVFSQPTTALSATTQSNADAGDWDVYVHTEGNKAEIITLDLSLINPVRQQNLNSAVICEFNIQHPDARGFPSKEESDRFYKFEEAIVAKMTAANDAYAGRTLRDGRWTLYFYAADTKNLPQIKQELGAAFKDYSISIDSQADASWKYYRTELYPTSDEMERIQNQRVIRVLVKHGDDLSKPRRIDHWIYFKNEADRADFLKAIATERFEVESKRRDDRPGQVRPFVLQLWRVDAPATNSIDELTLHLKHTANRFDANYDGWETSVEAPSPATTRAITAQTH